MIRYREGMTIQPRQRRTPAHTRSSVLSPGDRPITAMVTAAFRTMSEWASRTR